MSTQVEGQIFQTVSMQPMLCPPYLVSDDFVLGIFFWNDWVCVSRLVSHVNGSILRSSFLCLERQEQENSENLNTGTKKKYHRVNIIAVGRGRDILNDSRACDLLLMKDEARNPNAWTILVRMRRGAHTKASGRHTWIGILVCGTQILAEMGRSFSTKSRICQNDYVAMSTLTSKKKVHWRRELPNPVQFAIQNINHK